MKKVRTNGFDCPLTIPQVFSWCLVAFLMASFVVTQYELMSQYRRDLNESEDDRPDLLIFCSSLIIVYALAYASMVCNTFIVTSSDPTDPTVALEKLLKQTKAHSGSEADKAKALIAQHAIYYCQICEAHVIKSSKHCATCNRCCYEFDHHCIWVSNDIGAHNYAHFLRMLVSTIVTFLVNFVTSTFAIALDKPVHLVLNCVTGVLALVFFILTSLLLLFHYYLIRKSLTTVRYLRGKKAKRATTPASNEEQAGKGQAGGDAAVDSEARIGEMKAIADGKEL